MKQIAVLVFVLFGLMNQATIACSCIGKSTVKESYKRADLVATGQVIANETLFVRESTAINKMEDDSLPNSLDIGRMYQKVSIQVNVLYKGKMTTDTLLILTGMGGGDCGYPFQTGKDYTIYARKHQSLSPNVSESLNLSNKQRVYWTNICKRTCRYNEQEHAALQAIAKPKSMR